MDSVQLGHYLGPVVPRDEYEDADVMRVLERLALREREKPRKDSTHVACCG